MKERPILFSGEMVKAILEGRKTQTRRIVKFADPATQDCDRVEFLCDAWNWYPCDSEDVIPQESILCPYGAIGERLWVKETFRPERVKQGCYGLRYAADESMKTEPRDEIMSMTRKTMKLSHWKPSIFMPRWASRITLEITSVRAQRLNDITAYDCIAEGIEPFKRDISGATITTFRDYLTGETDRAARQSYETLWESINGAGSWATNPFVWVVEFRKV